MVKWTMPQVFIIISGSCEGNKEQPEKSSATPQSSRKGSVPYAVRATFDTVSNLPGVKSLTSRFSGRSHSASTTVEPPPRPPRQTVWERHRQQWALPDPDPDVLNLMKKWPELQKSPAGKRKSPIGSKSSKSPEKRRRVGNS